MRDTIKIEITTARAGTITCIHESYVSKFSCVSKARSFRRAYERMAKLAIVAAAAGVGSPANDE